jgi:uncharacterized protein YjaZ
MRNVLKLALCSVALSIGSSWSWGQRDSHAIVFLTSDYRAFVAAAQGKDDKAKAGLHRKMIQTAMCAQHFADSEYAAIVGESFTRPIMDLEDLEQALERVEAEKAGIEEGVTAALARCREDFDTGELTFYILPPHPENAVIIQRMQGVMGLTAGSRKILLTVDPSVEGWAAMLRYAVAHEFGHVYWTRRKFSATAPWTLLDYLVFEGRGDYLARRYYPEISAPWTQALDEKRKAGLWKRVEPELGNEDFNFQLAVMFGSPEYPAWGGYSLGFDIVRTALEKSGLEPREWMVLEAGRILEMSAYAEAKGE